MSTKFSTIQDSIDTTLCINVHNPSGFYNISHAAKQFHELYQTDSLKMVGNWRSNAHTKALFRAVKEEYHLDQVITTRNETGHKGTYVHPALYRSFLMWLDSSYAIKIFAIIDKHQNDHVARLKYENTSLENTLSQLLNKVDSIVESNGRLETEAKDAKVRAKAHAKEAIFNLNKVSDSLNAKLNTVVTMLQEKSIVSTRNPANPKLVHNFVAMGYDFTHNETNRKGRTLSFIAGQESSIRNAMRKKYADPNHQWNVQIEKHYNANPIDLRNNIKTIVNDFLDKKIREVNTTRATHVDTQNVALKEEIRLHNLQNPTQKRLFRNEKVKVVKIGRDDIPIDCKKLGASYIENEYVTYDELLQVIIDVNVQTQASPYQSAEDNSSDEEATPIIEVVETVDEDNGITDDDNSDSE